jgi:hypothetical protein
MSDDCIYLLPSALVRMPLGTWGIQLPGTGSDGLIEAGFPGDLDVSKVLYLTVYHESEGWFAELQIDDGSPLTIHDIAAITAAKFWVRLSDSNQAQFEYDNDPKLQQLLSEAAASPRVSRVKTKKKGR